MSPVMNRKMVARSALRRSGGDGRESKAKMAMPINMINLMSKEEINEKFQNRTSAHFSPKTKKEVDFPQRYSGYLLLKKDENNQQNNFKNNFMMISK